MDNINQEEKQTFLRENILNRGYDVNEFVSFLKSKKGEASADIANWSMIDLVEVVQEFVSKKPGNSESKSQPKTTSSHNDTPINEEPAPDEEYGLITPEFVEGLKTETTEISKYDNLEITVTDPKKVDNGFFSKTFINFLITTNPLDINVRRRHSDFVWLRERLAIIFNMNILPRLPKKGKVNEDKHINKRMRNLEKFLMYLSKDPLVKNSQIFYDFLTVDDAEFEKRKKIYSKLKTPLELKDVKSIDGKIRIRVTPKREQILDNIKKNAAFNETALKKFNQNFKVLRTEMSTIINRVLSFTPLFDKLIKISTTFLDNSITVESYNQMKNIFKTWAETLKKQTAFFCNDIKEHLKLLSGNYHHMRDLIQYVETLKVNYYKISNSLTAKKNELFRKGEVSNWQLDESDKTNIAEFYADRYASYKKICYKDTVNAIKVKEKYGYHLNKILSEYQRLRMVYSEENKSKVINFCKKESQIMTDYLKTMGEINKVIEECKNKDNKEKGGMVDENINDETIDINEIEDMNIKNRESMGIDNIDIKEEPQKEEPPKEEPPKEEPPKEEPPKEEPPKEEPPKEEPPKEEPPKEEPPKEEVPKEEPPKEEPPKEEAPKEEIKEEKTEEINENKDSPKPNEENPQETKEDKKVEEPKEGQNEEKA